MKSLKILVLLLWSVMCFAQDPPYPPAPSPASNIFAAEYFFDVDPGFGSGMPITISPQGSDINLNNLNLNVSGLSNGIHVLFVRTQNLNGQWSQTTNKLIAIENNYTASPAAATNVSAAEYYFDVDPGFGNATPINISPQGLDVTLANTDLNVNGLSNGIHVLFVRTQNLDGEWSQTSNKLIAIENNYPGSPPASPNIIAAEYFVDTDPGFGSATDIPLTASQNVILNNEDLDVSGLSIGIHNIFIRTLDADGKWSQTNAKLFENVLDVGYPNPPPAPADMVEIEYFFDVDPGFGNGNPIPISPQGLDATLNNVNLDVSGLSKGIHVLFIRSRNNDGKWSQTSNKLIAIENNYTTSPPAPANMTTAEYFFDVDPGFGNGTPIGISPQGLDVTLANTDLDVSSLSNGIHVLFIRTLNDNGEWSQTSNKLIAIENNYSSSPPAPTNITTAEYFFDVDPGLGNGTPITISPQGLDVTLANTDLNVSSLSDGIHVLFIRSKNQDDEWSLTSHKLIAIEPDYPVSPAPTTDIVTAEYFIDTDPGFGAGTSIPITAAQDVTLVNEDLDVSGFALGDHMLFVRTQNFDGEWSQTSNKEFELVAPANAALNFDGVDDYLNVAHDTSLNLDDFTIETWVKTTQSAPLVRLITKSVGSQQNYSLLINNGKPQIRFDNGVSPNIVESSIDVNDGNWHHIAGVRNAYLNTLEIFVDGILSNSISTSGIPVVGTEPLNVGRFSAAMPTPYFEGDLDEVRIWNFPLCGHEIIGRYDTNIVGNEHGLVLYYDFNEGSANLDNTSISEVDDRSGSNNAMLVNFDLGLTPPGTTSNFVNSLNLSGTGIIIPQTNEWLGINTDWNNTSNWSLGTVPSGCDDVEIPNISNQPIIDELTYAYVGSITSDPNSILSINGILRVRSHIINDGTILFESQPLNIGQFDKFTGTISGSGSEEVERYIPAKRAFRLLSSPVTTTDFIFENWQESGSTPITPDGLGTHITGGAASLGFDQSGTNNPSMFTFDAATQNWEALGNTNATKLIAGEAYLTMVRGDRTIDLTTNSSPANETTLSAAGELFIGSNAPVLSTQTGFYNLIANPYQAVVDYSLTSKTDLTDFIYVWDASIGGENGRGGYVTVRVSNNTITDPNPTTSDASKFIAPGMSFFTQNLSTGSIAPSLTFNEDDKATGASQVTIFSTYPHFYINSRLYLSSDLENGYSERDAIGLRFSDGFTTLGSDEDATKFINPDENYAIVNNGLRSIDNQGIPGLGDEIELSISNYTVSDYSLTFVMENKPEDLGVFLVDNYLNTQTELTDTFVYDFTVDQNIPESIAENRFKLKVDNTTLGTNENVFGSDFSLYPNPSKGQFTIKTTGLTGNDLELKIYNVLGQQVFSQTQTIENNGEVNVHASGLSSGLYMIELQKDEQVFSTKLIIE